MRSAPRWAAVAAGTALLCAVPGLVGRLPARVDRPAPATLLARIQASATVPYTGYAESRGSLGLPSLPRLGEVDALLSATTRMRVWYDGPRRMRVDRLTPVGEHGSYRDATGGWLWSGEDRRATQVLGTAPLRLPEPADLLPPELARRLAAPATPTEIRALPARRIAGHAVAGLRITPRVETTIGRIDIWADPRTGVPFRVDVRGAANGPAVVTSAFLDVALRRPAAATTTFRPPEDAELEQRVIPDIVAAIDRFSPYILPGEVAGLPEQRRVSGLRGGAATYGRGYQLVAVLPLPPNFASSLLDRLTGPPAAPVELQNGDGVAVVTPVVATVIAAGSHGAYLVAGTVPMARLARAIDELLAGPLPFRDGTL